MAKRIGFFGGTFDPIHLGHLNLAIRIGEMHHLDQILFCPAQVSPTKGEAPPIAPGNHRLNMLQLALEDVPGCDPYDGEISRPGPSYTIDTIRELVSCLQNSSRNCGQILASRVLEKPSALPMRQGEVRRGLWGAKDGSISKKNFVDKTLEEEVFLIVAEDTAYGFGEWKEIDALLELAPPLVGVRHGFDPQKLEKLPKKIKLKVEAGRCQIPAMDISSTEVRERLKKRLYVGHLIPRKVLDYIHQNTIYSS